MTIYTQLIHDRHNGWFFAGYIVSSVTGKLKRFATKRTCAELAIRLREKYPDVKVVRWQLKINFKGGHK